MVCRKDVIVKSWLMMRGGLIELRTGLSLSFDCLGDSLPFLAAEPLLCYTLMRLLDGEFRFIVQM